MCISEIRAWEILYGGHRGNICWERDVGLNCCFFSNNYSFFILLWEVVTYFCADGIGHVLGCGKGPARACNILIMCGTCKAVSCCDY